MRWIVALAALLTAAPSTPQEAPKRWSTDIPPARFQGTGFVPVIYLPTSMIDAACRPKDAPDTVTVFACTRPVEIGGEDVRVVIMPDPCALAETEWYARIACHENGHYLKNWNHETP